jgi:spore coat protein U-like protein
MSITAPRLAAVLAASLLTSTTTWATCVSALSAGTCSATVSTAVLPFGNYDPNSGTAKDVASTVTVSATVFGASLLTTIGYTISLSTGVSGSISDRRMTGGSGGPSLGYNLYTTSNRDVVWGTNSVTDSLSAIAILLGTPISKTYTVYGRVAARQYVSSGTNYADTIVVTVNY